MMIVLAILRDLGPYAWFIVGSLFLIAEVVLPGLSLIWFGAAASLTGALLFFMPLGWEAQMGAFMAFAAMSVMAGRLLAARSEDDGADRVNRGASTMIGRELTLVEPILNGNGRASCGDVLWRVRGRDQAAGTRVRVVEVDAATLVVEGAPAEPEAAKPQAPESAASTA